MSVSNEQKLIDIIFDLALTIQSSARFKYMKREDFTAWIRDQLKINGFETEPQGSSWGILKKEEL